MTDAAFEWKKTGATREVFFVGRWAVKVPKITRGWYQFLCGLLANIQERELSKLNRRELCPVSFSLPGGWLVVMPKATPLTDQQLETFDMLEFLMPDDGLALPVEPKGNSFGMLDGRIVAVDYGSS
jgi:hypothetical protein